MSFTPQTKSGRIVVELPILLPLGEKVGSGKENLYLEPSALTLLSLQGGWIKIQDFHMLIKASTIQYW